MRERDPFQIRVIEQVPDRPFYKLDWGSCGFNSILNTVRITEQALAAKMPMLVNKKKRSRKHENCST
jgi:hypothetical protein